MRAKILNASAGSGKTWQLAYKYVRDVIEMPILYRHILAVTFTNKATEEMKSRILTEIHKLAIGDESGYLDPLQRDLGLTSDEIHARAREVQSCLLHDYSHFSVMTLDRFFQRVLRALVRELGLDLNYNVEIDTQGVLSRSADALVEEIRVDDALRKWLAAFVEERVEEGKRWDVREGILSLGDELFKDFCVESAANKEELERIVNEAVKSANATQNQYRALCAGAVDRVENKTANRYLQNVASSSGLPPEPNKTVRKQDVLTDVCDFYDTHIRMWNTASLLRENYRSFALLWDLRMQVQRLCQEENVMMLSDTKHILAEFIRHNDTPFIYEKVGNRFDRFLIDEFQDTSRREWENFLPLLHNAMAESTAESVLIVGDVKQSIYRWRGGDWRLLGYEASESLRDADIIHLQDNFRSLPEVVRFNNDLIARVVEAGNGQLNELLPPGLTGELGDTLRRAYTHHSQTPKKEQGGYVSVTPCNEEPPVVERIQAILDLGYTPRDILILVRTRAEGARVAETLLEFKRHNTDPRYAFDIMTQEALAVDAAPVVGFVISNLRLSLDLKDGISKAIFNRFLDRNFATELSEDEVVFFETLRHLSPEEAFERIVMRFGLGAEDASSSEIAYLQALHEQIIAFCTNRTPDTSLYLQYWDDKGHAESLRVGASATTIEILTIHKAKGLENKVILMPYCNWALNSKGIVWASASTGGGISNGDAGGAEAAARRETFPVKFKAAMSESDFSADYYREMVYSHVDAVNLLYVAVTRAVEQLHVFIPVTTNAKGETHARGIGQLVLDAVRSMGQCEFGAFRAAPPKHAPPRGASAPPPKERGGAAPAPVPMVLPSYPTSLPDMKLRLKGTLDDEGSGRKMGILLHRAFEHAATAEDIFDAIRGMEIDGVVAPVESERLTEAVRTALENPDVAEWFISAWDEIRTESSIVTPDGMLRPDRVMISPERVVVVDYKFGEVELPSHRTQVLRYVDLLRQMGYPRVEGYVWYVMRGKVIENC